MAEFQSGHFASLAPRSIAGNELGELRISVKRVWVAIIVNLRHAPGRQVIDRLLKKTKMPRLALTHELRAIGEYVLRILWESGVEPSCSAVSRRPAERSSSGFPH
ncbi:MAG TPA: hypothetical protein VNH18_20790 [Bryobacteraceae bacterium]|nr:hypothetical protein [Bryobacteraceae bacterium]